MAHEGAEETDTTQAPPIDTPTDPTPPGEGDTGTDATDEPKSA